MCGWLGDGEFAIMASATKDRGLRMIDNTDISKKRCPVTSLTLVRRRWMVFRFSCGYRSVMAPVTLSRRILESAGNVAGFTGCLPMAVS